MTTSRKGRTATRRIIAAGQAERARKREILSNLAIVLAYAIRRAGHMPMNVRHAADHLATSLNLTEGELSAGIEDKLAVALALVEEDDD